MIPNAEIYTQAVVIRTAFELRRSEYEVGIGYSDDVEKASRVMHSAVCAAEGVASDPGPEALSWILDASSVKIKLRCWSEPRMAELAHTRASVIAGVKKALQDSGIDMPFSTLVVLFHDQTEQTDGDRVPQREGWPAGESPPEPRHLNNLTLAEHDRSSGIRSDERVEHQPRDGRSADQPEETEARR